MNKEELKKRLASKFLEGVRMGASPEVLVEHMVEQAIKEIAESDKYQSIEDCIARAKYLALNKAGSQLEVTLRFHND